MAYKVCSMWSASLSSSLALLLSWALDYLFLEFTMDSLSPGIGGDLCLANYFSLLDSQPYPPLSPRDLSVHPAFIFLDWYFTALFPWLPQLPASDSHSTKTRSTWMYVFTVTTPELRAGSRMDKHFSQREAPTRESNYFG